MNIRLSVFLPIIALSLAAQPVRLEETSPSVVRTGTWTSVTDANASAGAYISSSTAGSTLSFNFTGDGLVILRRMNTDGGQATVSVDGRTLGLVRFDQPRAIFAPMLFDNLGDGPHTLLLTVSESRPTIFAGNNVWIDAFESPAVFTPTADQLAGLARYNQLRAQWGFPAARLSLPLSLAAQSHADYLTQNNQTGPGEVLNGTGFTGFFAPDRRAYVGYTGGLLNSEVLATVGDVNQAIDFFLGNVYQRITLADYAATNIGYGLSRLTGRLADGLILSSVAPPPAARVVVTYPLDNQTNVPLNFSELPFENPAPNLARPLGYPISVHIATAGPRGNQRIPTTGSLTGPNNQAFPVTVVSDSNDPRGLMRGNDFFLIPNRPLSPGTTYTARIAGVDANLIPFDQTWSFTTVDAGTPPVVTPPVVTPPVTLTPKQYSFALRASTGGLVALQADGTLAAPASDPPADGSTVTAAQRFIVTDLNGGEIVREDPVTIQAANSNFVSFANANALGATATTAGANETFRIAPGGGFSFQTPAGTYLSVQPNGSLLANANQRGATESFFTLGGAIDPRAPGAGAGPGAAPGSAPLPTGSFQPVDGSLTQISVGADSTVFGANANTELYLRTGGAWRRVETGSAPLTALVSAARVFAAIPGRLFVCNTQWVEIPMPAPDTTFTWISAASDGTLMAIETDGTIHYRDAQTERWRVLGGPALRVAVRSRSEYFIVRPDRSIERSVDGVTARIPNGALVDISVSAGGEVWGIGTDQAVYRYNGTGFDRLSPNGVTMAQVAVGNATAVWAISTQGAIYQWR